ncbi:hypothetical protein PHPALM_28060 [Phytophthora palmivora]|uniref:Uncharacterized protein n=1 Tax=Phytophthora palmivora TaxID=4796 RepID=A0A2P4XB47_9STRA|nr:hypothetical protein PHPALM_28060 [Phytophthora palmivora]
MLREEAVKLQGYLNQLKNRVCHAGKSADGMRNSFENSGESDNVWRQRSNTEYQERLHSEQTNKRLKQILDHQEKVFKTLSATIKRQQSSYVRNDGKWLSCLLYCASQPKYDEQSKTQVIEFVTITPLDCSSEAACDGIWGFIQKQSIPGSHPNTRRKNRNLTMHYRNCVLEFNSIYNIQKFVEHNRIVIAWSGILVLPSQSLQYRTQGYSTITPSKANSTEGCVVRTKATLYREDVGVDSNQHPEITEKAHNIAFGVLSVKIRSFWQTEQMRLVRDSMRCSSAW